MVGQLDMRGNWAGYLLAGCLLAMLTGCATLKSLIGLGPSRPKVNLKTIELIKVSPTELQLGVRLQVVNGNDFDLKLKNLVYELDAEGVVFASGSVQDVLEIPANNQSQVSLPVTVSIGKAVAILERLITRGEALAVEVRGQCLFSTPVGYMEVNIKETHSIYGATKK